MEDKVTVWCVKVGDKYGAEDVLVLRDQVTRWMTIPHQFRCLTDAAVPGVECLVPDRILPGWWAKLQLFDHATQGQHLYLDLDSVVIGPLERLLSRRLSMPANWAQSGHGGCQTCVMSWRGNYRFIFGRFNPALLRPSAHHPHGQYGTSDAWGDQGLLTEWFGSPGGDVIDAMRGVVSYKYHCTQGPPDGAVVVQFHGDPKPAGVTDAWVRAARSLYTQTG